MKLKTKLSAAVSACTINLMVAGAAQAQLEEIIVTAQKREQSLQEVPISVAVLTSEDLTRGNINTSTSLALEVPSIGFQEGFIPSASSFSIRGVSGFTFAGGLQPSVGLVVDGVQYARAGEYIGQLGDVERLEVLRGPQGTLFGRNTTAGVINITTHRPSTEEWEGYVEATLTDDEEQLYRGRISGPITDTVAASLTGYYQDREGFLDNISPGVDDGGGIEGWGLRGQLDIDVTDGLNVLFIADYNDSEHSLGVGSVDLPEAGLEIPRALGHGNGDAALGQKVLSDRYTININEKKQFDQELEIKGVSATVSWDINDAYHLVSISAYREWAQADNLDVDASGAQLSNLGYGLPFHLSSTNLVDPDITDHLILFDNEYFTQELRIEHSSESLEWTVGFYYMDFEEEVNNAIAQLYIPIIPGLPGGLLQSAYDKNGDELKAYSVFADGIFHLTDRLSVFGGYRWTEEQLDVDINSGVYFIPELTGALTLNPESNTITVAPGTLPSSTAIANESTTTNDWSGRLGLSWSASDDTKFYTSLSRSFVGTGADIGGFPNLEAPFVDPTTTQAFEVGVKMRLFDDSLQLNMAAYIQQVDDLQTSLGGFTDDGLPITLLINAGDLDVQGVELDAHWAVSDYVRLSLGLAYNDAEVKDLELPCWPGQTISTGCNLDADGSITTNPDAAVLTDVDGTQTTNAPELKYNIGLNMNVPLQSMPFNLYGNIGYVWQDDVHFTPDNDPLAVQGSFGLLNFALGIADKDGRYDVSVFGKNITDEEFINDAAAAVGIQGRRVVRVPRGAQAYYGVRLRYGF